MAISIGSLLIGVNRKPFIIAEMSGNHNQSLERAIEIVDVAAKAGAHALKIQTYTPDTMTLDFDEREFHIADPENLWTGKSLYKLYGEAYTPWEWHKPIFDRARNLGIIAFSTPFDDTAVEFLESLDVPCYKIASCENTDLPLIRRVAATGKPLIISTGMASIAELDETVRAAREAGCKDLILLKCTSTYPASAGNTNILTIPHMRELFGCEVGLSDHTMGIGVSVASVALGATVIEKHFTLSRADGGVDSTFSMEPAEMNQLVVESERAWQALGRISYGATEAEKKSLQYRRSLYVVQDLKVGDKLTKENLRAIRPGLGLPTKYLEVALGKTVKQDVKRGYCIGMGVVGMSPDTVLKFEGGYLRPLKVSDVHAGYVSGLNDPDVNRYLDGVKHTKQTTQSVIDFVAANEASTNSVLWGIWQGNAKNHCGTVRLHGIEHHHKTAHIGVCIFDKTVWGQHLGKKAISAITQWAINVLGLRWVEAGAYVDNIASQRAFLSAGYSWVFDIPGKYMLEGKPTTVKVFAACNGTQ